MTTALAIGCPPNRDASCTCGHALAEHPDTHGTRICPAGDRTFTLDAGDDLECPEATACATCDHPICREHTAEFLACEDGGVHCDDGCLVRCGSCSETLRLDHLDEKHLGERYGEW